MIGIWIEIPTWLWRPDVKQLKVHGRRRTRFSPQSAVLRAPFHTWWFFLYIGKWFSFVWHYFAVTNDFAVSKFIFPWQKWFYRDSYGPSCICPLHEPLFTVVKQLLSIRIFLLFSIGGKWTSVSAHKNEIKIRRNKLVNFVRRVRFISFDYSKNVPFCDVIKFNSRLKTMSCASRSAK